MPITFSTTITIAMSLTLLIGRTTIVIGSVTISITIAICTNTTITIATVCGYYHIVMPTRVVVIHYVLMCFRELW